MRGAYIELTQDHGELMPAFRYLATRVEAELDFWVHPRHLHFDPFAADTTTPELHPCPEGRPPPALLDALATDYDFVILATATPRTMAALPDRRPPALLVFHDVELVADRPCGTTPVVLSPRWHERLGTHGLRLSPYYLGPVEPERTPSGGVFAVPGRVVARKNYRSLVRALLDLHADGHGPDECRVRIVGRWTRSHTDHPSTFVGEQLHDVLDRHDLLPYVDFPDHELDHREFADAIRTSRYVVPLVDNFHWLSRPFIEGKFSASISNVAAGHCIPVVNDAFADSLGLPGGHRYPIDDLTSAMRAALVTDDDHLLDEVAAYRDAELAASADRLAGWLADGSQR